MNFLTIHPDWGAWIFVGILFAIPIITMFIDERERKKLLRKSSETPILLSPDYAGKAFLIEELDLLHNRVRLALPRDNDFFPRRSFWTDAKVFTPEFLEAGSWFKVTFIGKDLGFQKYDNGTPVKGFSKAVLA